MSPALKPTTTHKHWSCPRPAVSVTEGADNTFTVKLAFQPAANVTVSVARASGDTDLTVSGGASLTFTSANWNTAQTVTLAAAEDVDLANGSAVFDVTSTGLTTVSVTGTEADNERSHWSCPRRVSRSLKGDTIPSP